MGATWITGVCVRQNRLEWTVLRRAKESWQIHNAGEAELSVGEGGLGAALKPHFKSFKGKVSLALPTEQVLLRVALLPSTEADELRSMADLQAEKFSPFPIETVALSAETLETTETNALVAMAAVRRTDVEECGQWFMGAGSPPDVVDVEALAWWWGLKQAGQIPAHGSQLYIRADRGVEMVLARDAAPLLFRSLPPPPEEDTAAARDEWVGECAEEIGYSLTSLETEWGATSAPTLHVFHDPARPADWAASLQSALGIESVFTHPLPDLPRLSEGVARRLAEPAEPLAMDLAPQAWREADAARAVRRRLLRSATVFLAAWLLGLGIFLTLLNIQRGRLERLQTEVTALEEPALEVRRMRAKVREFTQYADRSHSALECLRVISETMPNGVDLNQFSYRKGNKLELRGDADASEKVYGFIQVLEQAGLFTEIAEDIKTDSTRPGRRTTFTLTCSLPGSGEDE